MSHLPSSKTFHTANFISFKDYSPSEILNKPFNARSEFKWIEYSGNPFVLNRYSLFFLIYYSLIKGKSIVTNDRCFLEKTTVDDTG